jgi:hypothetical protein
MASAIDTLCIHCNAALTPRDLSEGWCDSCGKRLPRGARPAAAATPEAPPVARTGGGRRWVLALGGIAFALLGAAAAFAAAG